MVQFNTIQKEITYKIVYYGPLGSGKTTNLNMLEQKIPELLRGRLSNILVAPKENLTIDFLPIEVDIFSKIKTRFNIFTIPGSTIYHATRKLFLQEVDGIIFVADSTKITENVQSLQEVQRNLQEISGKNIQIPLVIQWNKHDLHDAIELKTLQREVNFINAVEYIASAIKGQGVIEPLEKLLGMMMQASLQNRQGPLKQLISDQDLQKIQQKVTLQTIPSRQLPNMGERNALLDRFSQTRNRIPIISNVDLGSSTAITSGLDNKELTFRESSWDSPSGKVVMIKLIGKIGANHCSIIKSKILDHYMHSSFRLMLELSKVDHIHSSAFGMLIELANRAQILGGSLALVGLQEKSKILFEVMTDSKAITLFQNEEQALAFFSTLKKDRNGYDILSQRNNQRVTRTHLEATGQRIRPSDFTVAKHNIYISYSCLDADLALQIQNNLEQKQYGAYCERKIGNNTTSWNKEIGQRIYSCDSILILWSQAAANDIVVQQEWCLARGLGKTIIVWLVKPYPILSFPLQEAFIVDCVTQEEGIQYILDKHFFEQKISYNYNLLPPASYVACPYRSSLVNRDNYLLEIYDKLITNKIVILSQEEIFANIGGTGKTTLAIEFVYRLGFAFSDGVLWLHSGAMTEGHVELQRLAYQLGFTNIHPEMRLANDGIYQLKNYIQHHPQALLVIDHLHSPQQLIQEIALGIIPIGLGCYILAISEHPQVISGVIPIQLNRLGLDESFRLLSNFRMPNGNVEVEAAKKICELAGGALAPLHYIIKYLIQNPQINFSKYLRDLLQLVQNEQIFIRDDSDRVVQKYEPLFYNLFKKLWEILPNELARPVLETACMLPPDSLISKNMLALLCGFTNEPKQETSFRELLALLQSLGMIENIGIRRIRIPKGVYQFIQQNSPSEQQQNKKKKVAERVLTVYQDLVLLDREYQQHGLQYVLDVLELALQWSEGNNYLQSLQQALRREASSLQYRTTLPYFFIQQIYSRIFAEHSSESSFFKKIENSLTRVQWQPNTLWFKRINKSLYQETKENACLTAAFSADGNLLASGNYQEVIIWDTQSNRKINVLYPGMAYNQTLIFHPQGNQLFCNHGHRVRYWDLEKPENSRFLTIQKDWIFSLAICNNWLASAGKEQKIYLRSLDHGDEIAFPILHDATITCLCFNANGNLLLSAGQDQKILLWDVANQKVLYQIRQEADLPTSVAFCSSKAIFACGFNNGQILIYQIQDCLIINTLISHCDRVTSLAFSPNGQFLVSVSSDRSVILWSWENGKLWQKFSTSAPILYVQFSADNSMLWICDNRPTIYKLRIMKINPATKRDDFYI